MTRRRRIEPQTLEEARSSLNWFLDAIARGELTAGPGLGARLAGAVAALGALITLTPERPGGGLWSGILSQPDAVIHSRDGLQRLLEAIRKGDLIAGPGYVARLEGSIAALGALLEKTEASATRTG